ncbi:MAG: sulfite exporter TauE/SafE family protein, partial [Acidimicrobiia bacterium]|nr:sulfite exporter TauE/SafE family protein [Acidimicrobiia bacterium]
AGLLSGLLGIGGGILMVPGFNQIMGLRLKETIATSLVCVGIFAVPGMITHAALGDIDWRFAILLALGVIPGARIGAALAIRADRQNLRMAVALFLGVISVIYLVGEVNALVR